MIGTGFWGPLYYNSTEAPPKIVLRIIPAPLVDPEPSFTHELKTLQSRKPRPPQAPNSKPERPCHRSSVLSFFHAARVQVVRVNGLGLFGFRIRVIGFMVGFGFGSFIYGLEFGVFGYRD